MHTNKLKNPSEDMCPSEYFIRLIRVGSLELCMGGVGQGSSTCLGDGLLVKASYNL
jgi:hypothetical protein